MRHIRNAAIALIAMSGAALIGSAASAQSSHGSYAPPYAGPSYSYGADRANPSMSPNGWDQDSPRDFQLQGGR
jgi:hypothetical protein